MDKEGRRSRQANRDDDQDCRTRDVHDRRKNVSKAEALEFVALFFPEGEGVGEYVSLQMCKKIRDSLSRLTSQNLTEVDIPLLKMGYQHVPKRWKAIQSFIHHPTSYSEELNDELAYLNRCDKVLGTGRR